MTSILPPWEHQTELRRLMRGMEAFYAAMEQRTGKTRPVIEEVSELYLAGEINALLIVAMPSGAPRNWIDDEIPQWLDPSIQYKSFLWRANKVHLKGNQQTLDELLSFRSLSIIGINGEAIITEAAKKYLGKFLRKRLTYVVGDEMTLLAKTPGAKRTKTMYQIGKLSMVRRSLDGTPMEDPMDLYSQYKFLDEDIFGFSSFFAFRNRYAVLEQARNWVTGTDYTTIKKDPDTNEPMYQNLDELQAKMAPYTFRVLFKDVFKDVPEPIYCKHYFQLHPVQRKAYDELKEEYETELRKIGTVTVAHVLTRYLRLQQIASGYWPAQKNQPTICPKCDGDGCVACEDLGVLMTTTPLTRLIPFDENPRLNALRFELERSSGKQIIWARFDQDIDDCIELARLMGRFPVRYDGRDDEEGKAQAKQSFQEGIADTFIAKTRAAGRALRVDKAIGVIYYSNEFGLLQRLQSEMRTQTGDRRIATTITDLVAEQTLDDEALIPALRFKKSLADVINKDPKQRWL